MSMRAYNLLLLLWLCAWNGLTLTLDSTLSDGIVFRPFKAFRPSNAMADEVSCSPYNLLSIEQAQAEAAANPNSFLHVCRPESVLNNVKPYDEASAQHGKKTLIKFIKQGLLQQDRQDSFYIYSQERDGRRLTGIIGLIDIHGEHYQRIKHHEQTFIDKKHALTEFIDIQQAHVDPVVLIHQPSQDIKEIIAAVTNLIPEQKIASSDGLIHAMWPVNDTETISKIQDAFFHIPFVYLADGHHRTSAAHVLSQRYAFLNRGYEEAPHNFLLAALFSTEDIQIYPYNRIVKDLHDMTPKRFLLELQQFFSIKKNNSKKIRPRHEHHFAMYLDGDWYNLAPKKYFFDKHNAHDIIKNLDVTILNEYILAPMLKVHSRKTSLRVQFIDDLQGPKTIASLCTENRWPLAFMLHAVTPEYLIKLADTGLCMPPKTTWIEPKVRPGLIVRLLQSHERFLW